MGRNRVNWMRAMGLQHDNSAFDTRKNDMLVHIRSRWSKRHHLDSDSKEHRRQLKEWIRPLIDNYPRERESPELRRSSNERRLEFYNSWAFAVNSQSREEKRGKKYPGLQVDSEIETTNQSALNNGSELDDITLEPGFDGSIGGFDQQDAAGPQYSTPTSITEISASASQACDNFATPTSHSDLTPISQVAAAVDWDDIEVAIDGKAIGLSTVWLPMIDLKPNTIGPCHWQDFDVKKLRDHVEADTERKIDMTVHDLVYTGPASIGLAVNARGSYKIALKWFVERGEGRGKILHLSVQLKDEGFGIGNGQGAKTQGSTLSPRQGADKSEFQETLDGARNVTQREIER